MFVLLYYGEKEKLTNHNSGDILESLEKAAPDSNLNWDGFHGWMPLQRPTIL